MGQAIDTLFQLMQDSPVSAARASFEYSPAWRQDWEDDILDSDNNNNNSNNDGDDDDDVHDPDSPTETSRAQDVGCDGV